MSKDELKQYNQIKREVNYISEKIEELEGKKVSLSKVLSDNPINGGSSNNDKLLKILIKIDKEIRQYWSKYDKLIDKLGEIERAIEKLDSTERTIMRLRYIDNLTWEEIAVKLKYSWQHIHRIHKNILKKI